MKEEIQKGWEIYHSTQNLLLISNEVLLAMLAELEAALPYLQSRGDKFYLALVETYKDHNTLLDLQRERGI